jgi:multimeric flavodoxin WrbA
MKVLAIIGSKRKKGNTHLLVKEVLRHIREDVEKEVIFINDYKFEGCIGCNGCRNSTSCVVQDDMQIVYKKMMDADLLILASPTYYYNVTSDMKKLIDRFFCFNIFDANDRTIWTSYNHINGLKKAVTISICEQETKEDIGFTTKAMVYPLRDIGYDVIYSLEAIQSFDKGDVLKQDMALRDAAFCGKQINLALQ